MKFLPLQAGKSLLLAGAGDLWAQGPVRELGSAEVSHTVTHFPAVTLESRFPIEALFLITPNYKTIQLLTTVQWINKLRFYIMEYYTTIKRNELLLHATWISP